MDLWKTASRFTHRAHRLYSYNKAIFIDVYLFIQLLHLLVEPACLIINCPWKNPTYANHFFLIYQKKNLKSQWYFSKPSHTNSLN